MAHGEGRRYPLPVFVAGRRIGVALGLAGVLTLSAACGGAKDEPAHLPPISVTPASSASSSPAYDEQADLHAATAVVREYFRLKNGLTHGATPAQLAAVITPTCSCQELVQAARQLQQKNRYYFGRATIRNLTPSIDDRDHVEVLVTYDSSAGGTKADDGEVIYRGQAHHGVEQLFLVERVNENWAVADIKLLSDGRA